MRVYLIQASGPRSGGAYQMPLSLPCLGAYLRGKGHDVLALDLNYPPETMPGRYLRPDPSTIERIVAFKPDVLGISMTTLDRHNARFWARLMKDHIPGLKVVVGGPHVSYVSRQVMENWPEVDYLVRFEGEVPLAMLLERIESGAPLDDVPGLSYRDAAGNAVETERPALVKEMDTLPAPDFTVFEDAEAMITRFAPIVSRDGNFLTGPTVHTMTSRGCPFLCKFCSTSEFWQGRTRFRSAENVIDELKAIFRRWPSVQNVIFHDDTITLRRSHIRELCERIIAEGMQFRWKAWTRLDILDADLLRLMKQAGCVCLLCGVESGTERGLKLVGKKLKMPKLHGNLKLIRDSGIGSVYSFIIGIPGETPDESLMSVRLARRLESPNSLSNVYFATTIYPGTAFCRDLELDYGPIDWDHPSPEILRLFKSDAYGNAIAPEISHPPEIATELAVAMGLPSVTQVRDDAKGGAARVLEAERTPVVRRWSPYLIAQQRRLAAVLPAASADAAPRVLGVRGRSREAVLTVALSDCYDEFEDVSLRDAVHPGDPDPEGTVDHAFGRLRSGEFDFVVDFNSHADFDERARARVLAQLRRTIAADGTALFFHRNADHLAARAARIVRARTPPRTGEPTVVAFRAMLEQAGFTIERQHSAGIAVPSRVRERLSTKVFDALGAVAMPRALGTWSMLVCRPSPPYVPLQEDRVDAAVESIASTAPAPRKPVGIPVKVQREPTDQTV